MPFKYKDSTTLLCDVVAKAKLRKGGFLGHGVSCGELVQTHIHITHTVTHTPTQTHTHTYTHTHTRTHIHTHTYTHTYIHTHTHTHTLTHSQEGGIDSWPFWETSSSSSSSSSSTSPPFSYILSSSSSTSSLTTSPSFIDTHTPPPPPSPPTLPVTHMVSIKRFKRNICSGTVTSLYQNRKNDEKEVAEEWRSGGKGEGQVGRVNLFDIASSLFLAILNAVVDAEMSIETIRTVRVYYLDNMQKQCWEGEREERGGDDINNSAWLQQAHRVIQAASIAVFSEFCREERTNTGREGETEGKREAEREGRREGGGKKVVVSDGEKDEQTKYQGPQVIIVPVSALPPSVALSASFLSINLLGVKSETWINGH